MKLFFKNKETKKEEIDLNSRIKILGNCCSKCTKLVENTNQAVANLELSETVVNIGDFLEIAKYNVLQTPALVIDNKVLSYGKLLDVAEIEKLITENI